MTARARAETRRWPARALANVRPRLSRMANFGTERYPPAAARRLKILNVVCYLIAFFTAAYAVQHIFVDRRTWAPVILINLALAAIALLAPFLHRFNELAGGLTIAGAELVALFVLTAYVGHSSGIHIQYVAYAATPFVVLGLGRIWLIAALVIIALVLHTAAWFLFPDAHALIKASAFDLNSLYVTAAVTTFGVIAATVYYAFHLAERAEAETDALLHNVLPDSIADRLKADPGATIADTFEEASVLFADLKGFVPLAKTLGAAATVEFLNKLMTEFDQLAQRHRVEKIKTIGDAYMVACGVPKPDPDHALRLTRMGLDMLAAMEVASAEAGMPLSIRIGMASGPVMAGVIGAKRLTYDVWGDTVNLAARLENRGEPGRIHISDHTRTLLEGTYVLERRGPLDLKGFGVEQTWLLVGPHSSADTRVAACVADLTPSRP
ncbi:MAG: adenylate/guanylate cyclase domain-containing protein [Bacteroidota bacterium]